MIRKIIATVLVIALLSGTVGVSAFTFPEPDWGALLKDKTRMVNETEFELYVESANETAPYYGAKFEPRSGAYIGMVPENAELFMPLGSYLTFIEHMYQDDLYYPANEMIRQDDVVATVGWTIHDLDSIDYDKVRNVLETLNSYNKPMIIRFANEMNVSALGNDPDKYISVFRTVADMIHEYENLAVVWSPNDMGALDRPFEYFYPGDEYVDWIGVSCYSIHYFQGNQHTSDKDSVYFMTGDYAWATNKVKPIMDFMARNNIQKPVMVSEGGVTTNDMYGSTGEEWTAPRLRNMLWYLIMKYPQIKMINYFNTHRATEAERFDIPVLSVAYEVFNEAATSGAYIRKEGGNPEFVFGKASDGHTLAALGGSIPLYTLACFAKQENFAVNYYIDGNWYHSSTQIPYLCNMDVSALSDGRHTLTISSLGESKTYDFYKSGLYVRFGAEPEISDIKVVLNGETIEFDVPPVIYNGRTLVPLRKIFEALDAEVNWVDEIQTVFAKKGDVEIMVQIGNNLMTVNRDVKELDVPAQLAESRTLVPVRAISEAFNCLVEWDEATQTVIITG